MPNSPEANPVFCVVGPTGCGKSAAAMQVAAELPGVEIVAADRYTAWAEMDIGTAKPTQAERKQVPHHLIDVFRLGCLARHHDLEPQDEPPQHDDVQSLGALATTAFSEINDRDGIALAVGGSPLMLAAISNDPDHTPNQEWRDLVASMGEQELRGFCEDWEVAFDYEGPPEGVRQKLVWAFETMLRKPLPNTLILGIHPRGRATASHILGRIDQMWDDGLPDEVERLVGAYGWVGPLKRAIGYKEFMREDGHGVGDHDKARREIIANTIAYAWDQSILFNRYGNRILWLPSAEAVASAIISYTRHYRETGEQPADYTKAIRESGHYGPM